MRVSPSVRFRRGALRGITGLWVAACAGCLDYGALTARDGSADFAVADAAVPDLSLEDGASDLARPGLSVLDLGCAGNDLAGPQCNGCVPTACAAPAADVIFCEDFEGPFPGTKWSVAGTKGFIGGGSQCRGAHDWVLQDFVSPSATPVVASTTSAFGVMTSVPVYARAYLHFGSQYDQNVQVMALGDAAGRTVGLAVAPTTTTWAISSGGVAQATSADTNAFKACLTAYCCLELGVQPTGAVSVWVNDQQVTDLTWTAPSFGPATGLEIGVRPFSGQGADLLFDEVIVATAYVPCAQ